MTSVREQQAGVFPPKHQNSFLRHHKHHVGDGNSLIFPVFEEEIVLLLVIFFLSVFRRLHFE